MKEIIELIKSIPVIEHYPVWAKVFTFLWLILTAVQFGIFLNYRSGHEQPSPPGPDPIRLWSENTGLPDIDRVHRSLNLFEIRTTQVSESEIADVLRQLFYKAVFFQANMQEEKPSILMFRLCETQTLLNHYIPSFKNSPNIRSSMSFAVTRMIKLNQKLSTLYASPLDVDELYQGNRKLFDFQKALPTQIKQPSPSFTREANAILGEIRKNFRNNGLMDALNSDSEASSLDEPISFSSPENWSFKEIVEELASPKAVIFPGFSDEVLNRGLPSMDIEAPSLIDAIKQMRIKEAQLPDYEVEIINGIIQIKLLV